MLPDYPDLKKELVEGMTGAMRLGLAGRGAMAMVSRFVVHEGSEYLLVRQDGSTQRSRFRRFEHAVAISPHDIELKGHDAIRELMSETREALARHQHDAFFDEIAAATQSAGTNVDAGGEAFSAEIWLDVLEKMEFSFDADGKWRPPTIMIHPDQADRVGNQIRRLESEPHLIERMDVLIDAKRREWLDREANRCLVD